jgi:hypothetical protein
MNYRVQARGVTCTLEDELSSIPKCIRAHS